MIRDQLLELCQIQDQITHCNEAGDGVNGRLIRSLQTRRNALIERIANRIERLENANGHTTKEVFEL